MLAKTITVKEQEALRVAAETLSISKSNSLKDLELYVKDSLKDFTIEQGKENLRGTVIKNYTTINEDERRTLLTSSNLLQGIERVLSARAERGRTEAQKDEIYQRIRVLKEDETFKALNNAMLKKGYDMRDPLILRLADKIIGDDIKTGKELLDKSPQLRKAFGGVLKQFGIGW